ncbi:matrix metallo ase-19-like [Brachionus plicatilis]|uniref:Matrix metallo ase-19-like n=1 Tax=Brachionus plicatilis TaxID=10195 RepID=A0A3M7RZZ5_BRAPC|nr:matrix metallo ase-19-like [Brachionus plicatilis]
MILKIVLFLSLFYLGESISKEDALKYLDRFGYFNKTKQGLSAERKSNQNLIYRQSLRLFQTIHGLNVTGILDAATVKKIKTPRCAISDFPSNFVTAN